MQLHTHLRQHQAVARPARVGIEFRDDFRQHGAELIGIDVVDDQARPQQEHEQRQAQSIEGQQQQPHVTAKPMRGRLGQEQFHGAGHDQAGNGQSQRADIAGTGRDKRTRGEIDEAQQEK